MKKNNMLRVLALLALLALLLLAVPASAERVSRLKNYALVVDGRQVKLSEKTGYVFRLGTKFMLPIETTAKAMGLPTKTDSARKSVIVERADGVLVEIAFGSSTIKVGDKTERLRVKTGRQDGQILTADILALKSLNARYKHYKPGAYTRARGYVSGALVVDSTGSGDLSLPDLSGKSDVLPDAAKEAAQTATQIVAIAHKNAANATLRFYEKNKAGNWALQYTGSAYLGKNGIGKTAEGDGKTPTGTFNLTTPFGILKDPGAAMGGYVQVNQNHYWSGQSGTAYYNRLIDRGQTPDFTPTKADEHLIDYKGYYDYGLFIDYNKEGVAGKGSAIFLHCKGSKNSTAGCVAIDKAAMRNLLQRLKDGAKIVIYEA